MEVEFVFLREKAGVTFYNYSDKHMVVKKKDLFTCIKLRKVIF